MISIGRNPTIELLRSTHKVDKILLEEGINIDSKISGALTLAKQKDITLSEIPRKELDSICANEPHQGIVAYTNFTSLDILSHDVFADEGLYIYIRESQYEYNLGAIIRTAEVAGAKGIIIPPKQEYTDLAARISMGAIFHVNCFHGSLFPTIKHFHTNAYKVFGIERGGKSIYKTELPQMSLMIIGGEDYALSQEVLSQCDQTISIPQQGKVNSLNMSVAAGVAIFEYTRQNFS